MQIQGLSDKTTEEIVTGSPTSRGSADEQDLGLKQGRGREILSGGSEPEAEHFGRTSNPVHFGRRGSSSRRPSLRV